jgi:caffeoyl-CoA O-methyltransferase
MSEHSKFVTHEVLHYLASRTTAEDDFLKRLKAAAQKAGIPGIWIAPEQAALVQILLRLADARDVLELGTLAGYSAIAIGRVLPPGGHLHTIEVEATHADFAEHWIKQAALPCSVTVHRGHAIKLLPGFHEASMDAMFIDADKEHYPDYLDQALRIVRPGGLILVDNAFAFGRVLDEDLTPTGKDEVWAIRAFNDLMARNDQLQGIIVPLGDGMWVSVRA